MINLLVTGGCGFIGSNFINYIFNKKKYNIINFDAMYYCANENNILEEIRNSSTYQLVKGNLCDYNFIEYVIQKNDITQIIHFAAQSHVDGSFENSLQYTQDNILGTHTLLEVCRKYGKIEKFIHVSTDEVYGESMLEDDKHKTEHSVLCPTNPYAATKAGAELIAQSYFYSYKIPIIITRGNNVYGNNQYPEKLIPKFINLLKNNKKVPIHGDGSNVRGFLYVDDTVSAFELILEKGKIGEIYNIGCDEDMEFSVLEITKILIKKIKNTYDINEWIEFVKDRPFNDKRYYISNNKLKELGWNINVNFKEGLNKIFTNLL
jgi:dTDP-glucose 4,6-dehydratase